MITITRRRILLLSAIIFILCATGVLILRSFFSRERIRAWVTPPLEAQLQRKVKISDAGLTLTGLRLLGLDVREPGAPTALLTSERVDLHWNLTALLKARLELDALVFDKPVLAVVREKDGTFNFPDLVSRYFAKKKVAEGSGKTESPGVSLCLSTVSMRDGQIAFVDRTRSTERTIAFNNVDGRISGLAEQGMISFHGKGQVDTGTMGSFRVEGTFDPGRTALGGTVEVSGLDLEGLSPYLTFKSTSLTKGTAVLSARFESDGRDRIKTQGTLHLAGLRAKIDQETLPAMNLKATFDVHGVRSQQVLEISTLQLVMNEQRCDFRGRLSRWRERPYVEFSLTLPSLEFDRLVESPAALENSAQTGENPSPGGKERTSSANEPPPSKLDRLKRLLPGGESSPSSSNSRATELPSAQGPGTEKTTVPEPSAPLKAAGTQGDDSSGPNWNWRAFVPLLAEIDAVGNVEIGWLYYRKFVASKVACQVRLDSGSFQVQPLRASLCGGQLDGTLQGKLNAAGWPFQWRCSLRNIIVDDFARSVVPSTVGRWSGNLTLALEVSGSACDLSNLQTRSDMVMTEAEFPDHPVIQKVAEFFRAEELKDLRFSQVSAKMITKRGAATIEDLHMEGSALRVEGNGTVALRDGGLELRLLLRLPVQYAGKIPALAPFLSKLTDKEDFTRVPLQISGTVEKAECRVDEQWLKRRFREATPQKPPQESQQQQEPSKPALNDGEKKQLQEGLEKLVQ
jgi:uncharacterized protein involved in outer membrane biogenesis